MMEQSGPFTWYESSNAIRMKYGVLTEESEGLVAEKERRGT